VTPGGVLDQGWIITQPCGVTDSVDTDTTPILVQDITDSAPEEDINGPDSRPELVEWTVYPNPAAGYVRIKIDSEDSLDYRVFDALGRLVRTGRYQRGHTIEIRNLKSGVYHIQLSDWEMILGTKKVLVMD